MLTFGRTIIVESIDSGQSAIQKDVVYALYCAVIHRLPVYRLCILLLKLNQNVKLLSVLNYMAREGITDAGYAQYEPTNWLCYSDSDSD